MTVLERTQNTPLWWCVAAVTAIAIAIAIAIATATAAAIVTAALAYKRRKDVKV